jgi:hypothetical protein
MLAAKRAFSLLSKNSKYQFFTCEIYDPAAGGVDTQCNIAAMIGLALAVGRH